jgi:fumarate reductase flavoprotein subunit
VDHPDTPQRAAEVARLRETAQASGRHAVQAALMPYEHLLPAGLRGRNERIDEMLPAAGPQPLQAAIDGKVTP